MHVLRALSASVCLSITVCRTPDQPAPVARGDEGDRSEEALGPVESVKKAATVHMPSHFANVLDVHSSLIRGSLGDARAAAREVVEEQPSVVLEDWAPYLYAMRGAAGRVAAADSIDHASVAAAELARTCGDCHADLGAKLAPVPSTAPPSSDDPAAAMRRHKWAFDRLWESIVIPSDEAWNQGVSAFGELPACANEPSSERDAAAILRARETMQTLQVEAKQAVSRDDRASIYGRMLPTCSSCHAGQC